jgi:hypothetical protein
MKPTCLAANGSYSIFPGRDGKGTVSLADRLYTIAVKTCYAFDKEFWNWDHKQMIPFNQVDHGVRKGWIAVARTVRRLERKRGER